MKLLKKIILFSIFIVFCCGGLLALVHKNYVVRQKIIEFADKNNIPQIKGYLNKIDYAGNRIEKAVKEKQIFTAKKENSIPQKVQKQKEEPLKTNKAPATANKAPGGDRMYYWIDKNGVKHYGDTPPENEEIINSWNKEKSKNRFYAAKDDLFKETSRIYKSITASKQPEKIKDSNRKEEPEKQQNKEEKFKKLSAGLFEVEGYRIELSGSCSGGKLKIRGRVSDGESCKGLDIHASLESKTGARTSVSYTVKNVGPGRSDLIRIDKRCNSKNSTELYEVTNITVSRIE